MARGKAKTLVCRYCGDVCENAGDRDHLSAWSHNHPAVCPYRKDEMPSLNGVHVGDRWRNRHTGKVSIIETIKLGGCGTYTDREPAFVLRDEDDENRYRWISPHPMWSLAEHWESLTRPGEWPVTWSYSKRYPGERSARDKWRTPGYRGGSKRRRQHAYFHAYHYVHEHSIGWEATNVLWQMDPELEAKFAVLDERDRRIREFLENVDPDTPEQELAQQVTDLLAA